MGASVAASRYSSIPARPAAANAAADKPTVAAATGGDNGNSVTRVGGGAGRWNRAGGGRPGAGRGGLTEIHGQA